MSRRPGQPAHTEHWSRASSPSARSCVRAWRIATHARGAAPWRDATSGEPGAMSVTASRRSCELLRFRMTTSLRSMDSSRWRLQHPMRLGLVLAQLHGLRELQLRKVVVALVATSRRHLFERSSEDRELVSAACLEVAGGRAVCDLLGERGVLPRAGEDGAVEPHDRGDRREERDREQDQDHVPLRCDRAPPSRRIPRDRLSFPARPALARVGRGDRTRHRSLRSRSPPAVERARSSSTPL